MVTIYEFVLETGVIVFGNSSGPSRIFYPDGSFREPGQVQVGDYILPFVGEPAARVVTINPTEV